MTVVVKLDTGDRYSLDRSVNAGNVAQNINSGRGKGALLPFDDNRTPSRVIYIDPDHVVSVRDDGHLY